MADLAAILEDLAAESADLDRIVSDLGAGGWAHDTPAAGWDIAHQIGHLAWTDELAIVSATDEEAFDTLIRQAWTTPKLVDSAAAEWARIEPADLLIKWRAGRNALAIALLGVPAGSKLTWFGPPMSTISMATARLMETWAHGQDVADALGVHRLPTHRLRHVAHIGVRTRNFSYMLRNETAPAEEFRVELTAPDDSIWTWGVEDATQRVTGPALDFCLLVTQRRHPDDLAIKAIGDDAQHWLTIAQAFAGTPGAGRKPGQFAENATARL